MEELLVPLLSEKVFFKVKYPMSTEDLIEVCNVSKYEMHEAGTTLYKQGWEADKCYIILKGRVSIQIPDPTGQGLVVPKKKVELDEEEEEEEVNDRIKTLTED